jgi:hypothetical protein
MRKIPSHQRSPNRSVLSADRLKASLLQSGENLQFLEDEKLREKKMWRLMMQYLSQNPSQLLNAIPSPEKRDKDSLLPSRFQTSNIPVKPQLQSSKTHFCRKQEEII